MFEGRALSDKKSQIDSLDGLRGMAVLIVILSHTSHGKMFLFPYADFAGSGKSGVFLFFVLSSFLLTLPFLERGREAVSKSFLTNYAFRRFLRVYPLYFVYLLVGLLSSIFLWRIFDLKAPLGIPFYLSIRDFFEHLFLLQGKRVTWSIVVEFHYYFLLPIIALIYALGLKNKVIPSVGFTIALIVVGEYIWPSSELAFNDTRLGPYLPLFLMGSLSAVLFLAWQKSALADNKKIVLAIELAGFAAIMALIFTIPSVSSWALGWKMPLDYYHKQIIAFGLLWSVVLFACLVGVGKLRRFFELPILRYLGFISFSAYLLHIIVLDQVKVLNVDIAFKGWLILILTIGLSHIFWAVLEKPTSKIRLGKT